MPQAWGRRGAGLGNEMFAWAKAFVGSQVLGARLLHPAWGLNERGYRLDFNTSRLDWLGYAVLRGALPTFSFTKDDYYAQAPLDLHAAVQRFAEQHYLHRRRAYVVRFDGMWGGFGAIAGTQDFIRGQLLACRNAVPNLYQTMRQLPRDCISIGLHIRGSDFLEAREDADYRGKDNVRLPLSWYRNVCQKLRRALGENARFVIVSDRSTDELASLIENLDAVRTTGTGRQDISDLLVLSSCDLIVGSVSTYSMWAAFLSRGRYIWFAPNLAEHDGLCSLWGKQPTHWSSGAETTANASRVSERLAAGEIVSGKGVPVGWDGEIPDELVESLLREHAHRAEETDLIRFGVVPRQPHADKSAR
jgi:hypothetical protein